jgi:hypothetical protein
MKRALPLLSAVFAVGAVLAGCASVEPQRPQYPVSRPEPPPPPPPPPTPIEEFGWSRQPGANVILARVNYRPRAGERWSCAGQSVALTPETSYSRDRIASLYGSPNAAIQTLAQVRARSQAVGAGLDYAQFVRSTSCDARDSFSFQELPDGAWFVIVRVRPVNAAGQPTGDGVVVMQRVEARGGVTRQVDLPGSQPPPARPAARPAAPRPAAPAARPAPSRPAPPSSGGRLIQPPPGR